MSFNRINDHIYLGSIMALRSTNQLQDVTHVLSVLGSDAHLNTEGRPYPVLQRAKHHKQVFVNDEENVNLLEKFAETNAFIDEAREQGGAVLVHCVAGISRSVTCVCAYLMWKNKWGAEEALEYVCQRRPVASPNVGFREQLECYHRCGYSVSTESKAYREFLLSQKARQVGYAAGNETVYTKVEMPSMGIVWKQTLGVLCSRAGINCDLETIGSVVLNGRPFAVTENVKHSLTESGPLVSFALRLVQLEQNKDPVELPISTLVVTEALNEMKVQTAVYRCKKCATTLASSASLRPHRPGQREACQDYFFEPIEWMRPELEKGELEGRLSCPKCGAKVGGYSWKGMPCTCAVWVTPTFKLAHAKVDRMAAVSRAIA